MKKFAGIIIVLVLGASLAGCSLFNKADKETAGGSVESVDVNQEGDGVEEALEDELNSLEMPDLEDELRPVESDVKGI